MVFYTHTRATTDYSAILSPNHSQPLNPVPNLNLYCILYQLNKTGKYIHVVGPWSLPNSGKGSLTHMPSSFIKQKINIFQSGKHSQIFAGKNSIFSNQCFMAMKGL